MVGVVLLGVGCATNEPVGNDQASAVAAAGTAGSGGSTSNSLAGGAAGAPSGGAAGEAPVATGGAAGAGGGTGGSGGFDPNDQVCLTKGSRAACLSCCGDNHAAWQMVVQATRDCVCTSPGKCQSACASDYCLATPGSSACYDCIFPTLASGQPCYTAAKQACGTDSDCNYYVECRATCVSTLPP